MNIKKYFLSYIVPSVTIAIIDLIVVSVVYLIMGRFNPASLSTGLFYSGIIIIVLASLGLVVYSFVQEKRPPVQVKTKTKKGKNQVDTVTLKKVTDAANRLYALNVATLAGALCVLLSLLVK